jgi:polysaccharide biosynthesis transport protein
LRPDTTNQPDLLGVLRRRWIVVLLAVLATAGAAAGLTRLQHKSYTATTSLVFGDAGPLAQILGQGSASASDAEREAATIVQLVSARPVADRTGQALHRSAASVAAAVGVRSEGVANVVRISASDRSPRTAARIANAYAREFIDLRRESTLRQLKVAQLTLERQLQDMTPAQRAGAAGRVLRERADLLAAAGPLQTGSVSVAAPADIPSSPSSPSLKLNIGLGVLLGLLLGLALAILRDRADRRVLSPSDQGRAFGLPVLASIPASRSLDNAAEVFRTLSAQLQHFHFGGEVRSLLITSSAPDEGKSTIAWHLGSCAALQGRRVMLLEADLREPTLAQLAGAAGTPGLVNVLLGAATLDEALHHAPRQSGALPEGATLDILPAGAAPRSRGPVPTPYELLDSEEMRALFREVCERYDIVIVDTPPIGQVVDAMPLVAIVDGVLIVARRDKLTREGAEGLREQLLALDAPVVGVVANGVKKRDRTDGYGYAQWPTTSFSPAPRRSRTNGALPRPGVPEGLRSSPRHVARD